MEIISIGYQEYFPGHYSGDQWEPERTTNREISEVFPIILKTPAEWKSDLNMFKATNEFFNKEAGNLSDYIMRILESGGIKALIKNQYAQK